MFLYSSICDFACSKNVSAILLIRGGIPHVALGRQSRMHPEISALLRPIYPEVADNHLVVGRHERIDVLARRVHFWDCHSHEEGSPSPTNSEEARRVVQLALYLIGQGYSPDRPSMRRINK